MSRLQKILIVAGSMALLLSITSFWNIQRDLQAGRRELLAVRKANEFLKKTLADMIKAIVAKDEELDRLHHCACDSQEKARPGVPASPDRNTAPVRVGNTQRIASASATK